MKLISLLILISILSTANAEFLPNSFSAIFEQSHVSKTTGRVKTSKGVIDYKFPGHIRFEVKSPDKLTYISNNKQTWFYRPPFLDDVPGEVKINSAKENKIIKFFDSLKHGLKTNKTYEAKKNVDYYEIVFSKDYSKRLGVLSAKLFFKDIKVPKFDGIKSVDLVYSDKGIRSLKLKDIQSNYRFKKKHFVFDIPKNTNISK